MELVADILLIAGALGAGIYCLVLSKRLRKFTDLENGVGGAIAVLSTQVNDMTKTLETARVSAAGSASSLDHLTTKAEAVARRLELLVAAMHDIPEVAKEPQETETAKDEDGEPFFLSKRSQLVEAAE